MIRKHSKMLIAAALFAVAAVAAAGVAACSTSEEHTWDYDNGVWTWNEDCSSATYTVSCLDDGCNETKDFASTAITYVTTGASCTETGSTTYTASVTIEDKEYSGTKTVTIPATGHNYKDSWVWAEDYSSATCTLACQNTGCTVSNNYTATESAITSTSTEATCTEAGTTTYTATITGDDGKTYSNSVTVETEEATGHSYDYENGVWAWSEDYTSVTFTVSCSNCGSAIQYTSAGDDAQITISESNKKEATCTEDGSVTYTATVTIDSEEYTDSQTLTIPATGHNYTASWNWEDDASSVTLTLTCSNDGCTDTQTYSSGDGESQITITAGETTEPTCTEEGSTTYTATITIDGTEYKDTKTVTTDATGHNYGYENGEWQWSEDYSSATYVVSCSKCDATLSYDATVSSEVTKEATEDEDGTITYTATATVEGSTYTDSKEGTFAYTYIPYSADYDKDFTTENQDGVWSYGEITYSWDSENVLQYSNGSESFSFTAATELNDGGDGWVMDSCEIKAGWINVGDMTGIVFTAPQDMTVDVELTFTGTIDNNALSLRVAIVTSDGTTISFVANGHSGSYSSTIELSEGDKIFFIFTNEAGDVEGAYPQANLQITITEVVASDDNDVDTDD